jgi:hypothetical protein
MMNKLPGFHYLRDMVNVYIDTFHMKKTSISSKIAKHIIKSGVKIGDSDEIREIPGLKYIREKVLSRYGDRVKNSKKSYSDLKKLKMEHIVPQDFHFWKLDEQLITRELKNSRKSKELDFEYDQRTKYAFYTRKTRSRNIKNVISNHYNWLSSLEIDFLKVEKRSRVHPFGSLHPFLSGIYDHYGVRLNDSGSLSVGIRITDFLRSLDRSFPRHYDPERLLDILSSPNLIGDHELLTTVLVIMGMRADLAPEGARRIIARQSDLVVTGVNGGYSWGDPYFSNFPSSFSVDFKCDTPIVPNPRFDTLIKSIVGQTAMHMSSFDGIIREGCVLGYPDHSTIVKILRQLGFMRSVYDSSNYRFDPDLYGLRV